jgi:hypothetical protein
MGGAGEEDFFATPECSKLSQRTTDEFARFLPGWVLAEKTRRITHLRNPLRTKVLEGGLEPPQDCSHQILSRIKGRTPSPEYRHNESPETARDSPECADFFRFSNLFNEIAPKNLSLGVKRSQVRILSSRPFSRSTSPSASGSGKSEDCVDAATGIPERIPANLTRPPGPMTRKRKRGNSIVEIGSGPARVKIYTNNRKDGYSEFTLAWSILLGICF